MSASFLRIPNELNDRHQAAGHRLDAALTRRTALADKS
jgi:hypothetical protein